MMSDTEVIHAVRDGDRNRFAELVERYQKMVYGIVWSRLGDADLCEDAAQETFVKAYRYLPALRNPERFSGWLARIARNVSTSLLRKRLRELDRRKRWQLEPHQTAVEPAVHRDDHPLGQTLAETLSRLPEPHRECLVLFYMEGKDVREAAELLDISEAAMKTRLHRARKALRGRLEQELESSLADLGPRPGFSAAVMPLLPSLPTPLGIGGASLLGKALSSTGKLALPWSMVSWMMLFPGVLNAALLRSLGRLEATNLAPSPLRGVRQALVRNSANMMAVSVLIVLLVATFIMFHFGPRSYFLLLALFSAWGTYQSARALRINRSPFTIGGVISNVAFFVWAVAMGLFHTPFWTFFLVMLVLNLMFRHTSKSRPLRHDYNLFLRAATGLFGSPAATEEPARFTPTQLREFVRFLGARYLVQDYRRNATGLRIFLPPVKPGIGQMFHYRVSRSTVQIDLEGHSTANLHPKDLRNLRDLCHHALPPKETLEQQVAAGVTQALRLFTTGEVEQAESILQAESDAQIFRKPTSRSREHRIREAIAITATVVCLLLVAPWIGGRSPMDFHRAKPVTRAEARSTLDGWLQSFPKSRQQLLWLLGSECVPPVNFVDPPRRQAYKQIMTTLLIDADGGDVSSRVNNLFLWPRQSANAMASGILPPDDLANLGLTPESVRAVLRENGKAWIPTLDAQSKITTVASTRAYTMPDIEKMACRLACLKAFDCLDFVDADQLAHKLAAAQVTPDWPLPAGYQPLDTAQAAGLFDFAWCDLRSTHGALWALQTLGRLDLIDREACIEGILRFHTGRGRFVYKPRDTGIHIHGNQDETYYALESLAILNALDRIPDLNRWQFEPKKSTVTKDGRTQHGVITYQALTCWAYQLRLEQLRDEVKHSTSQVAPNAHADRHTMHHDSLSP